jgi:uncharacterized membrane protein YtjA (UPF0391 family)
MACLARLSDLSYISHRIWPTGRSPPVFYTEIIAAVGVAITTKPRRQRRRGPQWVQEFTMLHYAVVFLVVALIAAVLGFGGIAAGAAGIAKILFVVFLIMAVVSFIFGYRRR